MKKHKLLILALFIIQCALSQEGITVTAGQATGSGGSSSISVGLLNMEALEGLGGSASPGFVITEQPETLSNEEFTSLTLKAITYPNPTQDYIVLSLKENNLNNLSYAIYNINGSIITNGKVIQSDTQINMQDLATGTYLLKVNKKNTAIKTFKIIKN